MNTRWIFLRGLTRDSRHWGEFPAVFSAVVDGAVVTCVDLPGNGALHRMESPMTIEAMLEYSRRHLALQGVRPPFYLLALSLGGMVAAAWCERYPQEVAGCVLINASLRPFSPFFMRLKPRNYPALLGLALARSQPEEQERIILRLTSRDRTRHGVIQRWARYRREAPVTQRNTLRQLVAAIRYRAGLPGPGVPVLVLASAADRLVDARCSQALADAWRAEFAMHPDAGHDLPLDDGLWIARQVHQWLLSVAASRKSENAEDGSDDA